MGKEARLKRQRKIENEVKKSNVLRDSRNAVIFDASIFATEGAIILAGLALQNIYLIFPFSLAALSTIAFSYKDVSTFIKTRKSIDL